MDQTKERRHKLFIYKSVQKEMLRIVLWTQALTVVSLVGAGLAFIYTLDSLSGISELHYLSRTVYALKQVGWIYLVYLVLSVIFAFCLSFYAWLKISHLIAGPLYRIKTQLEEYLRTGEFKSIRLRDKDQIQDIAELINSAVEMSRKEKP